VRRDAASPISWQYDYSRVGGFSAHPEANSLVPALDPNILGRVEPLFVLTACGLTSILQSVSMDNPTTLSRTERFILEMLIARGEAYALEMVRESGGGLKRGTVYVVLGRMEEKGFVRSRKEEHSTNPLSVPRRLYVPTGLGERVLRAWQTAGRILAEGVVT